ncbi:site-specific integrase [Castellaniella sp.]|uniref:tyrosine-type recombinase/integrase n=1 Tax=Castellaniella sp. TaxID=1955812 RepID=UPI002AFF4922|nr:site-specific integrase [Castellaniella sp.]
MTYVIVYRDEAQKQRQEKLADVGAVSAHAARALGKARLTELHNRHPTRSRRPTCPTMDRFFYDKFLPAVRASSRSHETHASIYRNHVRMALGGRRLDEISQEDILHLHENLCATPVAGGKWKKRSGEYLAATTVKRIMILVRHILNTAISSRRYGILDNPTHVLQLKTVRSVKGKFLTRTQLQALTAAAAESQNANLLDILKVLASTGLRRDNVLKMQWRWFNAERGTLEVPMEEDKAKKGFILHLAAGVVDLLRQRQQDADGLWVFPNPQTGQPYHSCYNAWDTIRRKAGMPNLRMHDLRHTFASMMLDSGADIVDVQHALAHTQLKTTAVYLHLTESRKRTHANAAAQATGVFA